MDQHEIQIKASYTTYLLIVGAILVMMHCGLYTVHHELEEVPWLLRQLFDLDEENNLPTWFSGFLLLNCALVLSFAAKADVGDFTWQWRILSAGFLLLSIDEVAGLHETFHTAIDFNWTIMGGTVVAVVGVLFVPFLLGLPRKLAMLFVLAGSIYVGGAIVVEWFARNMDEDTLAYTFATALEESMEMLGAWLFLRVNLVALKTQQFRLQL